MFNTTSRNLFFTTICFLFFGGDAFAQLSSSDSARGIGKMLQDQRSSTPVASKSNEYTIGGITVSGTKFLDNDLLITVSGLAVGDKLTVPSDEKVTRAIRNLWKQDLFSDISISATKFIGDKIFLDIHVEERPRLSKYNFKGIRKSEAEELQKKIGLIKGRVVTEATKKDAIVRINKYYSEKGFNDATVSVKEWVDTVSVNTIILTFDIAKGNRTKINQVNIAGNTIANDTRLKRTMKGTKEMSRISFYPADRVSMYDKDERSFSNYMKEFNFLSPSKTMDALNPYMRFSFFSSSKFNEKKFEADKQSLIAYYNSLGHRDAIVIADTIYKLPDGNINIDIKVREGSQYYFGDITWKGNTKYSSEFLTKILGIKRGDVYNLDLLETRLGRQLSPEGGADISSLYMDDGYLFFNVDPVEISIMGDTINYEMRITEGPQATIKNVDITGNFRTNEHVIRRELRTLPGNKFSRTDLIRSQREIANLGFFDQEKIGIQPKPNQEDGTVDIEYTVVEKSNDQLQLSAGFGGGISFYGNVGVTFNNFSLRNILKPKFWDPLPVGDGQKFSVNYQSNGRFYNSLNFSFTEPWLGGKKPNALTTNFLYSKFNNSTASDPNASFMRVLGGGVSISRRVKWPDDNFIFTAGVNYQNFKLKAFELIQGTGFDNGPSNNLYLKLVLARYSVDAPLYPRSGSNINFTFQFTPPYSRFSGDDYSTATASEKYKWIEYHKYRFTGEWYQSIVGKMVFKFATKYGFMGYYNPDIGFAPFERFQVGGDGLSGQNFFVGRDIIAHRGYRGPYSSNATIFNKYTAEVRYPFSLSPTSTIYGLMFVEAANAWPDFKQYNPSKLNRSAGMGIRVFLPMFGLLGLDYGVGFDRYNKAAGVTKLKDIANFTFMLGFEPD
ncbi:MAG: outer membrane protein assembly factor [Chitinophagales bacterium]|nr:outer membrane protein assembly factor [Chitinophagaceae bacterium]MCB9064332.1 outer membrane protein assembly factor [Chitinophagales bacterium]